MDKSKEDMSISELIDREKRIREDEARKGFDYTQQKKLPNVNYGEDGSVNDKINNIRYDANLYQNNKRSQMVKDFQPIKELLGKPGDYNREASAIIEKMKDNE